LLTATSERTIGLRHETKGGAVRTDELTIRPITHDDIDGLRQMFVRSSPSTRYLRFFTGSASVPEHLLRRLVDVDHDCREAVVALAGDDVVGMAGYDRVDGCSGRAELAVVVEDSWQRHGLGRRLVREVVRLARRRDVDTIVADMLSENQRALRMVRRMSPAARPHTDGSETHVEIPLEAPRRRCA
jgi:RimJ/RimL family protein N-acetyltransferase